jgi:hypothetical protein
VWRLETRRRIREEGSEKRTRERGEVDQAMAGEDKGYSSVCTDLYGDYVAS